MSALFLAVVAALFAALGDVFQRRVTRVQTDHLTGRGACSATSYGTPCGCWGRP